MQGPTKRHARITVAMIQSVTSAGFADDDDALRQFGLVVVDEVHHLPARTFAQLLPKLSSRHVLGLSATLRRADGLTRAIFWQMGPLLCRATRPRAQSTTQYALVETEVAVREPKMFRAPDRTDWTRVTGLLAKDDRRNMLLARLVTSLVREGRYVLVISALRRHLDVLRSAAQPNGGLLFVGETTAAGKRRRDDAFQEGPRVIFTTKAMCSEGFDWPACDVVLFATPFSANAALEQAVGRAQRSSATCGLIVDLVDASPALRALAAKREAFYRRKGYGAHGALATRAVTA